MRLGGVWDGAFLLEHVPEEINKLWLLGWRNLNRIILCNVVVAESLSDLGYPIVVERNMYHSVGLDHLSSLRVDYVLTEFEFFQAYNSRWLRVNPKPGDILYHNLSRSETRFPFCREDPDSPYMLYDQHAKAEVMVDLDEDGFVEFEWLKNSLDSHGTFITNYPFTANALCAGPKYGSDSTVNRAQRRRAAREGFVGVGMLYEIHMTSRYARSLDPIVGSRLVNSNPFPGDSVTSMDVYELARWFKPPYIKKSDAVMTGHQIRNYCAQYINDDTRLVGATPAELAALMFNHSKLPDAVNPEVRSVPRLDFPNVPLHIDEGYSSDYEFVDAVGDYVSGMDVGYVEDVYWNERADSDVLTLRFNDRAQKKNICNILIVVSAALADRGTSITVVGSSPGTSLLRVAAAFPNLTFYAFDPRPMAGDAIAKNVIFEQRLATPDDLNGRYAYIDVSSDAEDIAARNVEIASLVSPTAYCVWKAKDVSGVISASSLFVPAYAKVTKNAEGTFGSELYAEYTSGAQMFVGEGDAKAWSLQVRSVSTRSDYDSFVFGRFIQLKTAAPAVNDVALFSATSTFNSRATMREFVELADVVTVPNLDVSDAYLIIDDLNGIVQTTGPGLPFSDYGMRNSELTRFHISGSDTWFGVPNGHAAGRSMCWHVIVPMREEFNYQTNMYDPTFYVRWASTVAHKYTVFDADWHSERTAALYSDVPFYNVVDRNPHEFDGRTHGTVTISVDRKHKKAKKKAVIKSVNVSGHMIGALLMNLDVYNWVDIHVRNNYNRLKKKKFSNDIRYVEGVSGVWHSELDYLFAIAAFRLIAIRHPELRVYVVDNYLSKIEQLIHEIYD